MEKGGFAAVLGALGSGLGAFIMILISIALIQSSCTPQEDPAAWVRQRQYEERQERLREAALAPQSTDAVRR